MIRYISLAVRPRVWTSDQDYAQPDRPSVTVWERDTTPEPTGLLDAAGVPIYRVEDRRSIGFRNR
jgi:hypothetical protein